MNPMQMAALCRQALADGGAWPEPLAFADAVTAARLDGSADSLARLDTLLRQLHEAHRPTPASWAAQPGGEAFLILAAVALGLAVERAGGVPIEWLDRTTAAGRLPPDMPLPEDDWARLVGIVANSAMVPLAVVQTSLFDDEPDMSCEAYAERWVFRAQQYALLNTPPADINQRCQEMLDALAAGQPPTGGLLYDKAIRQAQLDYSSPSLQRLDALLQQIREQVQPQRGAFLMRPAAQNFLQLVAFYAAMCTARVGQLPIKWLSVQEIISLGGEVTPQFETQFGCLIEDRLHYPLNLVCGLVFMADAPKTLQSWSKNVIVNAKHRLVSIKRPKLAGLGATDLPPEWATAVEQAGRFAAQSLFMVEGGSTLVPQMLEPKGQGFQIVVLGLQADDAAYEASARKLADNPGKLPWQLRATDGIANLPTGRTDAITIELRCYPGGFLSRRRPLSLTVVCPYRPASSPRGFAIHTPKLFECDAPASALPGVLTTFYQGVDSFHIDTPGNRFSWDRYLDESI